MGCRAWRLQEFIARGPAARSRHPAAPRRRKPDRPNPRPREPQEQGERGPALLGRSQRLEASRRRMPAHHRHLRQEPREPGEQVQVRPGRSRPLEAPRRRRRDHPRHLGSAGPGREPSRRCRLRSGRWLPTQAPRSAKATNGAWQGPRVTPPSWERNPGLASAAVEGQRLKHRAQWLISSASQPCCRPSNSAARLAIGSTRAMRSDAHHRQPIAGEWRQ